MQSYYEQSVNEEAFRAPPITSHGPTADRPTTLPSVSFLSGAGHQQEYKEEAGIYMITMASGGEEYDSQARATLLATKTVASVTIPSSAAPQKATKRLIFQLDDQQQQRDTLDLEEKVYQRKLLLHFFTFVLLNISVTKLYTLLALSQP